MSEVKKLMDFGNGAEEPKKETKEEKPIISDEVMNHIKNEAKEKAEAQLIDDAIDYVSVSGGWGIYAKKLDIGFGGKVPRGVDRKAMEQYLIDRVQKYRSHFRKILEAEEKK